MTSGKLRRTIIGFTLALAFIAGCGAPADAPSPEPSPLPQATALPPPTATSAPPTATPEPPTATTAPPTATPEPPTPTTAPPTATPIPAPIDMPAPAPTDTAPEAEEAPPRPTSAAAAVDAAALVGKWQPLSKSRDAMFLQLGAGGACRQASSLERLAGTPEVECTYALEGTDLLITAVKLHGVPECPSPTGKYRVRPMAANQIELVAAGDSCAPRRRSTAGVYQRIP